MTESIIKNVRIASYNCNSIRSEIDVIREILTRCDILLCQEIILPEEEISFVYGIDHNFSCSVVPSRLPNSSVFNGRPVGRYAIFFRKDLNFNLEILATIVLFWCRWR